MEKTQKDPTQPWHARQATGFGRADWVVMGQCPLRDKHEPEDDLRYRQCAPDCEACCCSHCWGEGTHCIAEGLTEAQAKQAVAMGTLEGVRKTTFGATIGERLARRHQQTV